MISDTTNIRVRYADTDQMKIVYYAEYFKYFEEGRSSLLRNIGFAYSNLIDEYNVQLPVIEAHINFFKPALYEDSLIIKTYVKALPSRTIRFDSEIYRNDLLIVNGYSLHVFYNPILKKIVSSPVPLLNIIEAKMKLI